MFAQFTRVRTLSKCSFRFIPANRSNKVSTCLGPLNQHYKHVHSSPQNGNNSKEPLIGEGPQKDRFLEMMDDRTYSLFRSLHVDVEKLKEDMAEKAHNVKPLTNQTQLVANPSSLKPGEGSTTSSAAKPAEKAQKNYIDTQEVYSELRYAGLTRNQAEILMRILQQLINTLVNTCTERAVPNSAGANEAYLFDAASSEVRNEISNSRQSNATSYRAGLARLQRDVEILQHEATEMTNLLISDLDIEIHERKNSARWEESVIQLKIQELNNKISTRLNSELKSEIENLRWQITRRSLAAIGIIAGCFIWLTQTNSNKKTVISSKEQEWKSSGSLVQVPILAPSVSTSHDIPIEHHNLNVEDLSSIAGTPEKTKKE